MGIAVKVSHLTKTFGSLVAVDDLSFSVEDGDVYGFLGQNGAGKSTTLRMLLGLVFPSAGEIDLMGQRLPGALRHVGAVIEQPELYVYLSGLENLEMFARLSGIKPSRKLLLEQLDLVGLVSRAKDKVGTYSMGMKQRLGLAVAMVHDPRLLVLDEPTNGLDPQGIADIRQLILKLSKERGKTLIVSSHLLSEIQLIASRMLIVDRGRKVVEGRVAELLDPSGTLVFLETTDDLRARTLLEGAGWTLEPPTENLVLRLDRAKVPELAQTLVGLGIGITRLEPRHSLEDYFLHLTTRHADPISH